VIFDITLLKSGCSDIISKDRKSCILCTR